MSKNIIQYGKVSFADICVGSIVKIVDCDDNVAVGIVEEKIEAIGKKSVKVRMGFEETISILIEEKRTGSDKPVPYVQLESIIRSYV